jgi:hypothetical protein
MVQGLKFLSKKQFNPQNRDNRTRVFEAELGEKHEKERIRRRQEELKRERDDEEIYRARGDLSQAQLKFMYNAPPGMENPKESAQEKVVSGNRHSSSSSNVTEIQPGDDAAAAAFRQMLAASAKAQQISTSEAEVDTGDNTESNLKYGAVMQGTTMDPMLEENRKTKDGDIRSALEKAVGRKDHGASLSLEEQVKRFPQLKHAPMAKGMSSGDVNVSFKPLGSMIRNVRCLACGVWGHSMGDRECSKTGWNPFDLQRPAALAINHNSIRPNQEEKRNCRDGDDASVSSTSSSEDSRRRRKRKHKSKKKKRRHKDSKRDSKRHRRRRSRSESPRRRRSRSGSPRERRKYSRHY